MSIGAENLKEKLNQYMMSFKNIKVTYENKAIFNLRWDIVINTKLPIVFEFQGEQHYKFTKFFHKDIEGSVKAKEYDNVKRKLHNNGKVILIEVNKKDLTYLELCDLLEPYREIIKEENDECGRNKKRSRIYTGNNNKKNGIVQREKRETNYFSVCNGTRHK